VPQRRSLQWTDRTTPASGRLAMPKNASKTPAKDKAGGKAGKVIAKGKSRKPKDPPLASHAGRMMSMSKRMGSGSYSGSKEAMAHHSGKTLATAMGSKKQSALSHSVSSIASGPSGSAFAQTGVFQMMAVHAHKGTLDATTRPDKSSAGTTPPASSFRSMSGFGFW